MASVKDIKRRKKSIENTMKITKAMELVAFSKLRKSLELVKRSEPFFYQIYDTMRDISSLNPNIDSIYFKRNATSKKCYIIIAGDKGLSGSYNANILRFADHNLSQQIKSEITLIPIGKKSHDFFKKNDYNIYKSYEMITETLDISLASEISKLIIDGFLREEISELSIIFTDFSSVLNQTPVLKRVLPLSVLKDTKEMNFLKKNITYDSSAKEIFDFIVPLYLTGLIFGAAKQSFASEQASRRLAMESANKSAKDMLKELDLIFNKTRQSQITQEITEIVSGANAL